LNELATLQHGQAPAWAGSEAPESPRDFPYAELARPD
jgi:hypothetical protein